MRLQTYEYSYNLDLDEYVMVLDSDGSWAKASDVKVYLGETRVALTQENNEYIRTEREGVPPTYGQLIDEVNRLWKKNQLLEAWESKRHDK